MKSLLRKAFFWSCGYFSFGEKSIWTFSNGSQVLDPMDLLGNETGKSTPAGE